MTWDGSKLLRHTLQFIAIVASIFTGMTRISDYKHHWSDVLGGLLIGAITACIVVRLNSNYYILTRQVANSLLLFGLIWKIWILSCQLLYSKCLAI